MKTPPMVLKFVPLAALTGLSTDFLQKLLGRDNLQGRIAPEVLYIICNYDVTVSFCHVYLQCVLEVRAL